MQQKSKQSLYQNQNTNLTNQEKAEKAKKDAKMLVQQFENLSPDQQ
jgi:hypothetical protein